MKKTILLPLVLLIAGLVMTSCVDKTDNPAGSESEQPQQAERRNCTIIYYGHGGSNLDYSSIDNVSELYNGTDQMYDQVNVVVQYKYSSYSNQRLMKARIEGLNPDSHPDQPFTLTPENEAYAKRYGGQFIRFAVDNKYKGMKEQMAETDLYGEASGDVGCPDSLTNYLKWAVTNYPADHYVLILSDHGGGYMPHDELPYELQTQNINEALTRGVVYDDEHNTSLSAKSIAGAVEKAGVHLTAFYYDACLMNTAEYLFELAPVTDYVAASTFSVSAWGGKYLSLLEGFSQAKSKDDIENTLINLCNDNLAYWGTKLSSNPYFDMSVLRTSGVPAFGTALKSFVDKLVEAYTSGDEKTIKTIDDCTAKAYKVDSARPMYDLVDYYGHLCEALPEVFPDALYNQLVETFYGCLVTQGCCPDMQKIGKQVDLSVLIGYGNSYAYIGLSDVDDEDAPKVISYVVVYGANGQVYISNRGKYNSFDDVVFPPSDHSWNSNFAATYNQTAFDKATGWSRWIAANKQAPNAFCDFLKE